MNDIFSHGQIRKLFPWVRPRTLISWSERGLIRPEYGDAKGRGSSRGFSYANLVEIAAVSELLRLGIPFVVIIEVTGNGALRDALRQADFDIVFYFRRSLSGVDVPADVESPWVGTYGVVPFDEFLKTGGALALDVNKRGQEMMMGNPSVAVVLNLKGLKYFVDARIKRVL